MDGRTVEPGNRTRTNRTARGFSGRLRGCSSPLVRHGPFADPWWPPRGSERPFPPRRATVAAAARRERQSGCARSLAFFDPPSLARSPPSLSLSPGASARARAIARPRPSAPHFTPPLGSIHREGVSLARELVSRTFAASLNARTESFTRDRVATWIEGVVACPVRVPAVETREICRDARAKIDNRRSRQDDARRLEGSGRDFYL